MTRPPCAEQDRAAAEQVEVRLGEAGYAVASESFDTRPSAEPWLAAYAGLAGAAALAIYSAPLVAVVAGIAAVVLHARDSDGRPLLKRRTCSAANVVARAPEAPSPDVVVVAPLRPRPVRFRPETARALVLSLQTLMVAIPASGAAVWLAEVETEIPSRVFAGGVAAAVVVATLALILYRPPSSADAPDASPALDVLLELAPLLRSRRVWLVVTGTPGSGTAGIEALLERHPEEVAGATWLNLEPGAGPDVVAISEEGTWRERRGDRWLLDAAEEAGAEGGPYRAAPTNATPLLARRRRALTLLVPAGADSVRIAGETARAALDRER